MVAHVPVRQFLRCLAGSLICRPRTVFSELSSGSVMHKQDVLLIFVGSRSQSYRVFLILSSRLEQYLVFCSTHQVNGCRQKLTYVESIKVNYGVSFRDPISYCTKVCRNISIKTLSMAALASIVRLSRKDDRISFTRSSLTSRTISVCWSAMFAK
jgi:hypothetical protein